MAQNNRVSSVKNDVGYVRNLLCSIGADVYVLQHLPQVARDDDVMELLDRIELYADVLYMTTALDNGARAAIMSMSDVELKEYADAWNENHRRWRVGR